MIRKTPQTLVVLDAIHDLGHASNAVLLDEVHKTMPQVSATTVHRITARLVDEGLISATRIVCGGSAILDSNIRQHHHFRCNICNELQDVYIDDDLINSIKGQASGLSGFDSIVINGICKKCKELV